MCRTRGSGLGERLQIEALCVQGNLGAWWEYVKIPFARQIIVKLQDFHFPQWALSGFCPHKGRCPGDPARESLYSWIPAIRLVQSQISPQGKLIAFIQLFSLYFYSFQCLLSLLHLATVCILLLSCILGPLGNTVILTCYTSFNRQWCRISWKSCVRKWLRIWTESPVHFVLVMNSLGRVSQFTHPGYGHNSTSIAMEGDGTRSTTNSTTKDRNSPTWSKPILPCSVTANTSLS